MTQYYSICEKVAGDVIDGEAVIMDLNTGRYFSAQNSGAVIWNCVEAGFSQSQIVENLCDAYGLDQKEAHGAAQPFLEKLIKHRLIEPVAELAESSEAEISLPKEAASEFKTPELMIYEDMQDLLLLDPIHDAAEEGWPKAMPLSGAAEP